MKKIIIGTLALTFSLSSFAFSPKTIEYRKDFDEVKTLSFGQKMIARDFKIVKEEYINFGGWICKTTLELKDKATKMIEATGNTLTLQSMTVQSPYATACIRLPNFKAITDGKLNNNNENYILLNYTDESGTVIKVALYGNKRVKVIAGDKVYKGFVTESF